MQEKKITCAAALRYRLAAKSTKHLVLVERAALAIQPSSERETFTAWIRLEKCPALQSQGASQRKALY